MKAAVVDALCDLLGADKVDTESTTHDARRYDYWVLSHLRDWRGDALPRTPGGRPRRVPGPGAAGRVSTST